MVRNNFEKKKKSWWNQGYWPTQCKLDGYQYFAVAVYCCQFRLNLYFSLTLIVTCRTVHVYVFGGVFGCCLFSSFDPPSFDLLHMLQLVLIHYSWSLEKKGESLNYFYVLMMAGTSVLLLLIFLSIPFFCICIIINHSLL